MGNVIVEPGFVDKQLARAVTFLGCDALRQEER